MAMEAVGAFNFVTLASLAETGWDWPAAADVLRVATLRDYNTRVVVLGTMLLGLASGVVGTYMLLRKRALVGDALSHATLPGIAITFILVERWGATGGGKSLPLLLTGATVTGLLGVGAVMLIRSATRVKEDAALGIVLSVFFGVGVAALGIVQRMNTGNAAGLESFIYGKTASMLRSDALLIGGAAATVILAALALYKEFALLSFDGSFAAAQGWPVRWLDAAMMALVTGVTVIGLQAVGLILVIALLIVPAAAARFWTDRLPRLLAVAGAIGAGSGLLGAAISALQPHLPAGAIVVLVSAAGFIFSAAIGPRRGLLARGLERRRLHRSVARQHLLRAMYEAMEVAREDGRREAVAVVAQPVSLERLAAARAWSRREMKSALRLGQRERLIETTVGGAGSVASVALTPRGLEEARQAARTHRLWELFLLTHADIAASHVDRGADRVEHVLGPEIVAELEAILARAEAAGEHGIRGARSLHASGPGEKAVPKSPHVLDSAKEREAEDSSHGGAA